jgi:hypothetical protein
MISSHKGMARKERTVVMKFSIFNVLLLTFSGLLGCVGAAEGEIDDDGATPAEPGEVTRSSAQAVSTGPVRVSLSTLGDSVTGLIASTGNLYWTSFTRVDFGPDFATLWRAGKNNTPGGEVALYTESGDRSGEYYFGSPVYALVGGTYYGFFTANYSDGGVATSQIKRVPLTGGGATVLANAPAAIGPRDLVTDGSSLFWADAGGIRRLPIGGGSITTLVASASVQRLGLDATYLYYAEGALIRRIPRSGGAATTRVVASATVSALSVNVASATIYWGEVGGAVKSSPIAGGAVTTHQGPLSLRTVSSVGYDGSRVFWADCTSGGGTSYGSPCAIRTRRSGVTSIVTQSSNSLFQHLRGDATSLYWADASGIARYNY